jgi:hypothetical protein
MTEIKIKFTHSKKIKSRNTILKYTRIEMSNMTGNIIVMCRFRSRSRLWRLSQLSTTLFQLYHGGMYRFNVTRSVMSEPLWSKVETGLQWKENKTCPFKVNLIT